MASQSATWTFPYCKGDSAIVQSDGWWVEKGSRAKAFRLESRDGKASQCAIDESKAKQRMPSAFTLQLLQLWYGHGHGHGRASSEQVTHVNVNVFTDDSDNDGAGLKARLRRSGARNGAAELLFRPCPFTAHPHFFFFVSYISGDGTQWLWKENPPTTSKWRREKDYQEQSHGTRRG
jgi:hypothetical protein